MAYKCRIGRRFLGRADRVPDATLEVAEFDPEKSLVLRTPGNRPWWVWVFVLEPIDEMTTRLLVCSRIRLPENPVIRATSLAVLDPVSSLMTTGMLRGIRRRAEQLVRTATDTTGSDPNGKR